MHGGANEADFLSGGGEMGALMRAYDWSTTPLGPLSLWPQSLRTATSLLLRSPVPIVLLWGPDGVMIYNDAYSGFAGGRHPRLLGSKVREGWPEVASFNDNVMRVGLAGGTLSYRDQELTLFRNGIPELVSMNLDYSPVLDESGRPGGVLAIVVETTEPVRARRRLSFQVDLAERLRTLGDPDAVQLAAAQTLGRHLNVARAGYGEIDATESVVTVRSDWTSGAVASLTGEARVLDAFGPALTAELRRGRTLRVVDCRTDPRSAGDSYAATWEGIQARSLLVVPLLRNGRLSAILYLHEPEPRLWSELDISLAEDAAARTWEAVERARAEKALRESELRLRLAVEAGRMAIWRWSAAADRIETSPELNRLLGFPPDAEPSREEINAGYLPEQRQRVQAAARAALESGDRYFEVEFRYGLSDPARSLLLRAEILLDGAGRPESVVGVLLDITERERTREQVQDLERDLRAALSAGLLGTYVVDHVTGRLRASPGLPAIYGYPEDRELTLEDLRARYHPDDRDAIMQTFAQAAQPGIGRHEVEFRLMMPDGEVRWIYGKGEYLHDGAGRAVASRGVVMDITDRKRAEEHQDLLINELNHRVKNTLATVQSIVAQTLRASPTNQAAHEAIEGRLLALSRTHDVLTREHWEHAELREIVREAVAPYAGRDGARIEAEGPEVRLAPRTALALAMALQELVTNAVKYGALSNRSGRLRLTWRIGGDGRLHLLWEEKGGPAVVPPTRRGFGSRLVERSLVGDLQGEVSLSFAPSGLVCAVAIPLDAG